MKYVRLSYFIHFFLVGLPQRLTVRLRKFLIVRALLIDIFFPELLSPEFPLHSP